MITVRVTYNRVDVPESLVIKGKEVNQQDLRMRLDKLIMSALKGVGMKWYTSGTMMVGESLERDHAFDCDLEKILNAPTEEEINAELSKFDVVDKDVVIVS